MYIRIDPRHVEEPLLWLTITFNCYQVNMILFCIICRSESTHSFVICFREPPIGVDTVGAVAIDVYGNLAYANSTGGLTGKRTGRIGDSPLPGTWGIY